MPLYIAFTDEVLLKENPDAEKCSTCGKAYHYIGRCPVVVAMERNDILEEAAKVADSFNRYPTLGPAAANAARDIAEAIRGMKDLEAARH